MKFRQDPRLLTFINDQVVPFLFSFCYFTDHGTMPYGELAHGGPGIIDYYKGFFNVTALSAILRLLKILTDDSYRGHLPCPCGSGINLRRCHGKQLLKLMQIQSQEQYLIDCFTILYSLTPEIIKTLNQKDLPKKFLDGIQAQLKQEMNPKNSPLAESSSLKL